MKFRATVLFLFVTTALWAQNGYEIHITLKPFRNQYVYLGHYYGKQLPIVDSVKLNDKSEGVIKGPAKLGGGIYLIGYPDRAHNFEILIDKNQKFSIIADTATVTDKISFINSPENEQFAAYQRFMVSNGRLADGLLKKRAGASAADSIAITRQIVAINEKIRQYRLDVMSKSPNSFLTTLLKAMKEPDVPKNELASRKDSMYAYHYFKSHYWDGVNFYDDRLARTPFFENRIDKYFEQLVYPNADSVIKELDWMLGYASISEEMQKFLLLKFVNRYLNQKYMWEDAVFVHLYENFFSNKNYSWLNEKGKKLIQDRAYSLMANIFGSPASDIDLPDTAGKKTTLYGLQAPYTLLAIWDPTCSHCKEMIPKLDTLYRTKWKAQGVRMFAMAKETDGTRENWMSFIHEHKLNDWTQVYYSKVDEKARLDAGLPGYSQLFDVQSFPTLYLLDKDKRIIAKKITEKQVDEILEFKQRNPKNKTPSN